MVRFKFYNSVKYFPRIRSLTSDYPIPNFFKDPLLPQTLWTYLRCFIFKWNKNYLHSLKVSCFISAIIHMSYLRNCFEVIVKNFYFRLPLEHSEIFGQPKSFG